MSYYAYRSSKPSQARRKNYSNNRSSRKGQGQYINPLRFIRSATASKAAADAFVPLHAFADFKVDPLLKANLEQLGYEGPTPIQDETIPLGLAGRDVIGIANTGTGKTAAFAVPLLQRLITEPKSRALIIAPTRELAQQIDEACRVLAKGSRLSAALLIGGSAMGPQLRDLRSKPRIVIGTPGRIKDHLERHTLQLNDCNTVVLDEVDRMLDMGFVDDVRSILQELASERQSFFFSATLDSRVSGLIRTFSNDPVTISLKAGEASDHVNQDVVHYVSTNDKLEKLHDLLISGKISKAIVFDETQRSVERLGKELIERGFQADAIHGGKTQGQRQRALKRFKANEISILVATDVAARGIDVVDISHVINYSIPQTYDTYVHRIGRAGRAGRDGYALTFVTKS